MINLPEYYENWCDQSSFDTGHYSGEIVLANLRNGKKLKLVKNCECGQTSYYLADENGEELSIDCTRPVEEIIDEWPNIEEMVAL